MAKIEVINQTFNWLCDNINHPTSESEFYKDENGSRIIIFENCIFNEKIKLHQKNVGVIKFIDCELDSINIDTTTKIKSLTFRNTTIKSLLFIANNTVVENLYSESSVIKILALTACRVNRLAIKSTICSIAFFEAKNDELEIIDGSVYLHINNSTHNNIRVKYSEMGAFDISTSAVKNIRIIDSKVFSFSVTELKEGSELFNVDQTFFDNFKVSIKIEYQIVINAGCKINNLCINNNELKSYLYMQISDSAINKLDLFSFNNFGLLVFNNVKAISDLTSFKLTDKNLPIVKDGRYVFESITRDSVISIVNSNLGNSHMIGFDIDSFKKVYFQNSKIQDCFTSDVILPSKDKVLTLDFDKKEQVLEQRRLFYA